MIIDTSALIAILFGEGDAASYEAAIATATVRRISSVSVQEAGMVLESRYGEAGSLELDRLLHQARIEVADFTAAQSDVARRAFRRFGKGRHRAGLNFGDCASYALSKTTGEPLLAKGGDFSLTDLECVRV
jgi:ribonuclease VapC